MTLNTVRDDTQNKRLAILHAARELFATHGYDDTTIAEVARMAGVAVGTIYLYFENKHDILVDVCLTLNEDIADVIQSPAILAMPVRQVPRAIIEATFHAARENKRFMGYFRIEAQTDGEKARLSNARQRIADALDAYLQWVISQGQMPPFNTAAYAELLNNLVDGALLRCFGDEQGAREEFYRENLIELIERLFFGPPLKPQTEE